MASDKSDTEGGLDFQTVFTIVVVVPVLGGMISGPLLGFTLMTLSMFDSLYILAGFR